MKEFLKRGNIFKLEEGMAVYAKLPEKFFNSFKAFSKDKDMFLVTIGDEYSTNERFVLDNIKEQLISLFQSFNVKVNNDKIDDFFENLLPCVGEEILDTNQFLTGEYVVTDTDWEYVSYSDTTSIKIRAKKLKDGKIDPDDIEIYFYQKGKNKPLIVPKDIVYVRDLVFDNLK